ncbi:MAG: ABC transporter ATP-binding protein [Eubacteriales bacterium]|nr:ABC transporter ATP-binding protein [Eubacteriales bacterium]
MMRLKKRKRDEKQFALFRRFQSGLLTLCAGAALQAGLQVALAVLTQNTVDLGIAGDERFSRWGTAMAAVILLRCGLHSFLFWFTGQTADQAAACLRHELFAAAEQSTGEQLQKYRSGKLLHRAMEDVRQFCDGLTTALPALSGNLFQLGAAFLAIGFFHPALALLLLFVGAAILTGAACLRPFIKKRQAEVRKADEEAFTTMQSYLQRIELLQSLSAEDQALNRFDVRQDEALHNKRRRRKLMVWANGLLSVAMQFGTGCFLLWGIWQIYRGNLTYGGLAALTQLLALLRRPIISLSGIGARLTALEVSAERLAELLSFDRPAEAVSERMPEHVNAIVFEKVTFQYCPEEEPVLQDCSMRLDLRSWTCLNGFSGLGKSTVFKLILGIYRPQSGRVYLETARGEIECGPATRKLFAYVPQDYALFAGSVLDNLRLVRPDADDRLCVWALEIAEAGFIQDLPQGLQTQLREQNSGLSMGQLQRLAIARAVLMERPVLLLDECTSALDPGTEQKVLFMLRSLRSGGILVTHHQDALEKMPNIKRLELEETR